MASGADAPRIRVAVAFSPVPGEATERALDVPVGATVGEVLRAGGIEPGAGGAVGIWGRAVALDAPVAAGDRVELYRPLPVDAKEARRRRAAETRKAKRGR